MRMRRNQRDLPACTPGTCRSVGLPGRTTGAWWGKGGARGAEASRFKGEGGFVALQTHRSEAVRCLPMRELRL